MAASDLEQLIDDWAMAWSSNGSGDAELILALFAVDCVFEDVTFGVVARGKGELRGFANRAFAAVPDFKYVVTRRFATSQWAVVEWIMSGTHPGDMRQLAGSGSAWAGPV